MISGHCGDRGDFFLGIGAFKARLQSTVHSWPESASPPLDRAPYPPRRDRRDRRPPRPRLARSSRCASSLPAQRAHRFPPPRTRLPAPLIAFRPRPDVHRAQLAPLSSQLALAPSAPSTIPPRARRFALRNWTIKARALRARSRATHGANTYWHRPIAACDTLDSQCSYPATPGPAAARSRRCKATLFTAGSPVCRPPPRLGTVAPSVACPRLHTS